MAQKYFISVTHDEILSGILQTPAKDRSLCFIRDFSDLPGHLADKEAKNFVDVVYREGSQEDRSAQELLKDLKTKQVFKALNPKGTHPFQLNKVGLKGIESKRI